MLRLDRMLFGSLSGFPDSGSCIIGLVVVVTGGGWTGSTGRVSVIDGARSSTLAPGSSLTSLLAQAASARAATRVMRDLCMLSPSDGKLRIYDNRSAPDVSLSLGQRTPCRLAPLAGSGGQA